MFPDYGLKRLDFVASVEGVWGRFYKWIGGLLGMNLALFVLCPQLLYGLVFIKIGFFKR